MQTILLFSQIVKNINNTAPTKMSFEAGDRVVCAKIDMNGTVVCATALMYGTVVRAPASRETTVEVFFDKIGDSKRVNCDAIVKIADRSFREGCIVTYGQYARRAAIFGWFENYDPTDKHADIRIVDNPDSINKFTRVAVSSLTHGWPAEEGVDSDAEDDEGDDDADADNAEVEEAVGEFVNQSVVDYVSEKSLYDLYDFAEETKRRVRHAKAVVDRDFYGYVSYKAKNGRSVCARWLSAAEPPAHLKYFKFADAVKIANDTNKSPEERLRQLDAYLYNKTL
jgi:hypothetical protein